MAMNPWESRVQRMEKILLIESPSAKLEQRGPRPAPGRIIFFNQIVRLQAFQAHVTLAIFSELG